MTEEEIDKLKLNREANLILYSEYNKTLRAWLVAYGIAVPALFITSKDAKDFLTTLENHEAIIMIFLLGMASQILIAFVNKFVSWSAYHRDDCKINELACNSFVRRIASIENSIWIDLIFDVLAILFFSIATVMLLTANVLNN